jgi:membrane protein YqaA with SNARE-associated domain
MNQPPFADHSGKSHRHTVKSWIESLAGKPSARWLLFLFAVIEGAIFPIPLDPLLITLSVANPRRSLFVAGICIAGSVIGSCIGYGIGVWAFEMFARSLLSSMGALDATYKSLILLKEYGIFALVAAGFIPIPYSVFSIASGMNQTLDFSILILGSILGRMVRFGLIGILFYFFGEQCKLFLEKHFGKLSIVFLLIVLILVVVLRWLL